MSKSLHSTELAACIGVSNSYAHQILAGKKKNVAQHLALKAFRELGVRIGLLAEMTDDDIRQLCNAAAHPSSDKCAENIGGNILEQASPAITQEMGA
jgi:transcriptional regulator with XRE-family HTH domain